MLNFLNLKHTNEKTNVRVVDWITQSKKAPQSMAIGQ